MNFENLGLSRPILDAISQQKYLTPSAIQTQAIPAILQGRDVMAAAQTGTGKTAAFALPMLEILAKGSRSNGNQVRALILTPTRELACQVGKSISSYGVHLNLQSAVVYGGVKIEPQISALRNGVDILVATPGRLLDLFGKNAVKFQNLEVLILDEADRMLDLGFIDDIKKILCELPKHRQNLMFTATFSEVVRKFAKSFVHNPVEISIDPAVKTAKTVQQWMCPVDKKRKASLLTKLIKDGGWTRVLVFTKTRDGADILTRTLLGKEIKAVAIHSNKPQEARTKSLARFKAGSIHVLVATDIAARGLDIDDLPHVVNFDLPNTAEDYVHRIGRTGRAGLHGEAISLVSADEHSRLTAIERLTKKLLRREFIDGFHPVHLVPETKLDSSPKVVKKVKNPGVVGNPRGDKRVSFFAKSRDGLGSNGPKTSPSRNAAAKGSSGRNSSGRNAPTKDSSGRNSSGRNAPTKDSSGRNSSGRNPPAKDSSRRNSSGRNAPAKDSSRRNSSGRNAPAKDSSGRKLPPGKENIPAQSSRTERSSVPFSKMANRKKRRRK
jgi:ATP-dependent RNA helicase RhlE